MKKLFLLFAIFFFSTFAKAQITFITPTDSLTVKHIYFGIDSVQAIISSPDKSAYILINTGSNPDFYKIGVQTLTTKMQRSIVINLNATNYATLNDTIINLRFEAQDTNKRYVYRDVKLIIHKGYRSGIGSHVPLQNTWVYVSASGYFTGMENTDADEVLVYDMNGRLTGKWKRDKYGNGTDVVFLTSGMYTVLFKKEEAIVGVRKLLVP